MEGADTSDCGGVEGADTSGCGGVEGADGDGTMTWTIRAEEALAEDNCSVEELAEDDRRNGEDWVKSGPFRSESDHWDGVRGPDAITTSPNVRVGSGE